MAESGFARMSAARQSSSNDRSPAVRLAKRLAAIDPKGTSVLALRLPSLQTLVAARYQIRVRSTVGIHGKAQMSLTD